MSFGSFINQLKIDGNLIEIQEPVSRKYDAARIAGNEKPHLFHNINGHRVAVNVLSSRDALCTALCINREDMVKHLASIEPTGEIKLVDDSPTMRRILSNSLKHLGYEDISEAKNGREASAIS